jgi:hypothetical protein
MDIQLAMFGAPAPKVALLESAGTTPALNALMGTNDAATSTDLTNKVFLISNYWARLKLAEGKYSFALCDIMRILLHFSVVVTLRNMMYLKCVMRPGCIMVVDVASPVRLFMIL